MNKLFNRKSAGIGAFPPLSQSFAANALNIGRAPLTNTISPALRKG